MNATVFIAINSDAIPFLLIKPVPRGLAGLKAQTRHLWLTRPSSLDRAGECRHSLPIIAGFTPRLARAGGTALART